MNRETDSSPPALFSQTGTAGQMKAGNVYWPDAVFNIDSLIKLALQPSAMFGFATARIPFDITAEAERLGCVTDGGNEKRQPAVISSPWSCEDLSEPPALMPPEDYLSGGRVSMHIEAAGRLSEEHPELFLTSCMISPTGLAGYLIGMENFMISSFMEPEITKKWVDAVTPHQALYAEALSEKSDNVFVITGGSEEVSSPDMFELFFPNESEIFRHIKESFSVAHSCGTTTHVLEKMCKMGSTALSVECRGDPESVVKRVGDRIVLAGGVDPIGTLMMGTPEKIVSSARRAAEAGYDVITPECGVPPGTPDENLAALAGYGAAPF